MARGCRTGKRKKHQSCFFSGGFPRWTQLFENYCAPLEERIENMLGLSVRIGRLSEGPILQRYQIDYDWTLPEGLDPSRRRRSERRVSGPLSVVISLLGDAKTLDLQVTFDNRVRDHRLRMIFPGDVKTDISHASAQFD